MNWAIIGSGNGLLPIRYQAITWTNAGLLSIGFLGREQIAVKFELEFYPFRSRKCILKCLLPKWWPFCQGGVNHGVYPTLGRDIQGLRAMGLSVQTDHGCFRIFQRSDWLYHSEQMEPVWGSVPCQKNLLCVRNKLFLGEIKFSQRRTHPVKSSRWQIVPMQESTNEWKNLTIF